jgi:predicted ATPase/DNA-binding winged helix-turn-helix (wHTH) protein
MVVDSELPSSGSTDASAEVVSFGPFRIQPSARRLERDGEIISLGSRAFDLLCLLIERAGEVVSKVDLMTKAWPDLTVDESSLRFQIAQLRRVLGDDGDNGSFVKSVTGRGYCFVMHVRTEKTQQAIRTETPRLNLPARLARIVGRENVVSALADHIVKRRFVTIRGPGGIGKTTVAVAFAHQCGDRFKDGTAFLDLGSIKEPTLVTGAVASAIGLFVPVGDPTPRLIDTIRDRQMLFVLDGCEHVIEAVAELAGQIGRHTSNVSLLTTSREALEIADEMVFDLEPLALPPDRMNDETELARYPSTCLFMERAIAAGYDRAFSDADAAIVGRICHKLDGMPLAIELVASRLSAHALIDLDELIGGRLRLAWPGRRTAPARHQSLSAVLDWSYQLISPAERNMLAALSVFPGPFSLEGVLALADEPREAASVLNNLEQLIAKSLVASRPKDGETRFRLLDTTRAYANEKLNASGSADAIAARHAKYVLAALTPRSYETGGDRPGGWHNRAELLSDARAALSWAFASAEGAALQMLLAAVCSRLFVEQNLLEECHVWARRALATEERTVDDRHAKVDLLWAFGHAAMFTERTSHECETSFWRGLTLAQELGDLEGQFRLLSRLHALYRRTGDRKLLLDVALRAKAVADEIHDLAAIARANTFVGIARHLSGDQQIARDHLRAGEAGDAAIPKLPADHFASPRGTNILSCSNLWLLGFPDQAVAVATRLADPGANPDMVMYCGGLCFAARVFRWVEDLDTLEDVVDRLQQLSGKHGFGPMLTVSSGLKGELLIAQGQVDRGVELLQQALPRMQADRFELHSGALAIAMVEGMAAQGRVKAALTSINARIETVDAQGSSWEMPELLRVRGILLWRQDDRAAADRDFLAAMAMAERQSALSWQLRAAMSRAEFAGETMRADVQDIYGRFAEGFETADLRAAEKFLRKNEMRKPQSGPRSSF